MIKNRETEEMIPPSTVEHFLEKMIEFMRRQNDYSERILQALDPNWTGPYEGNQVYGSPWAPVELPAANRESGKTEAVEVEASHCRNSPDVEARAQTTNELKSSAVPGVDDPASNQPNQLSIGASAKKRHNEPTLLIIQAPVEVSQRGEKLVSPDIYGKNLSLRMINLLTSSFPASGRRKCQNSRVIIDPWLPPPQRCDFRFLR